MSQESNSEVPASQPSDGSEPSHTCDTQDERSGIRQSWSDPIPIGSTDGFAPFPADALPTVLRNYADGLAAEVQVPIAMPALSMITVAAAAVAQRRIVQPRAGYTEELNLYNVQIGDISVRKSPIQARTTEPLKLREQELRYEWKLRGKPQEGEEPQPEPRMLIGDCTPEVLAVIMSENNAKIGFFVAEGGCAENFLGRYNGGKSNLDLLLSGYAGEDYRRDRLGDRKGSSPGVSAAVILYNPCITLEWMLQPLLGNRLLANVDTTGRGFVARCMLTRIPDPGVQLFEDSAPCPYAAKEAYESRIDNLLDLQPDRTKPIVFSDGARHDYAGFYNDIARRIHADLSHIRGTKMRGNVARLAGVLQLVEDPESWEVSSVNMQRALAIGDMLVDHQRRSVLSEADAHALNLLTWIKRQVLPSGAESFTLGQLREAFRNGGMLSDPRARDAALDALVRRGYLRQVARAGKGGPDYIINPRWSGHATSKSE